VAAAQWDDNERGSTPDRGHRKCECDQQAETTNKEQRNRLAPEPGKDNRGKPAPPQGADPRNVFDVNSDVMQTIKKPNRANPLEGASRSAAGSREADAPPNASGLGPGLGVNTVEVHADGSGQRHATGQLLSTIKKASVSKAPTPSRPTAPEHRSTDRRQQPPVARRQGQDA
jgi:hypothetical protein